MEADKFEHVQVHVEIIHQAQFLHMTWIHWDKYPLSDISLSGKVVCNAHTVTPAFEKKHRNWNVGFKLKFFFAKSKQFLSDRMIARVRLQE